MCWQCDHPGSTRLDYLEHISELIDCYGWAVQGVQRDRIHPPWAYTVGLTLNGRPELVVTGMPTGPRHRVAGRRRFPCAARRCATAGRADPADRRPADRDRGGCRARSAPADRRRVLRAGDTSAAASARRRPGSLAVGGGIPRCPRRSAGAGAACSPSGQPDLRYRQEASDGGLGASMPLWGYGGPSGPRGTWAGSWPVPATRRGGRCAARARCSPLRPDGPSRRGICRHARPSLSTFCGSCPLTGPCLWST